jgi:hypothetical protein
VDQSTLDIGTVPLPETRDVLTEILRNGGREMLARAIEAEVTDGSMLVSSSRVKMAVVTSSAMALTRNVRSSQASDRSRSSSPECSIVGRPTRGKSSDPAFCLLTFAEPKPLMN